MNLLGLLETPLLTNILTITLPILILVWRYERRLTVLETEHRLFTKKQGPCQQP
jgi:hypothetical protein